MQIYLAAIVQNVRKDAGSFEYTMKGIEKSSGSSLNSQQPSRYRPKRVRVRAPFGAVRGSRKGALERPNARDLPELLIGPERATGAWEVVLDHTHRFLNMS